jgi:condensin complex subunit 2
VKELELEFTVDPLFKKTSADFDEGGAAGLLMNHLGSDSNMRVVFDAGDAKVDGGDEDEDEEEEDDGLDDDEKLPEVDISKLKGERVSGAWRGMWGIN